MAPRWSRTAAVPDQEGYFLTRALFLRLLGLVYGVAFLSLWPQIEGLVGSQGILPAAGFLAAQSLPPAPPHFVRARLYTYRFADPVAREREGVWWQRELEGPYGPVLSRQED